MLQNIKADIERYRRTSATFSISTLRTIIRYEGLQATLVYRVGRVLQRTRWWFPLWPLTIPCWLLYALAATYVRVGYGIRIALSAQIGPGLYVNHFGGIELCNCQLGAHCSIGQQTKIGRAKERPGPTVGSRVWAGGHANIFGAISIGDGATIGAGSLVTDNVAMKSLCLGRPSRVVLRDYDNSAIL
jgi:serine O-acetyltransferase